MKTIRTINKFLKENIFYLSLPFGEIARIKKVEFDSENKRFGNGVKDIGAFYLIYDSNGVENISEGLLYGVDKNDGIEKIYNSFKTIKDIGADTISF